MSIRKGKSISFAGKSNNIKTYITTNNAEIALNLTHVDVSVYHSTPSVANTFFIQFSASNEFDENDLEDALEQNITQFLLELGTGFAYMGREFKINVGNNEEFIDMLFYNTSVHAYVVIEIKAFTNS